MSGPSSGAASMMPDVGVLRVQAQAGALTDAALAAAIDTVRRHALSDVARALECAEALVALAPAGSVHAVTASAAQAHVLAYAGRLHEAVERLQSAIGRAQAWPCERAQAQLAMVQPLARLGRLDEAIEMARQAATGLAAAGRAQEAAKARTNEGIVLRMKGSAGEALGVFDQARIDLESDQLACAVVDSNRAEALLDLERFDEAIVSFERARGEFISVNNVYAAAIVEGNLADLFSRLGRVDEALPRFERARLEFERAGSGPDVARLYSEEAQALAGYGAWRESRLRFTEAIRVLRGAGFQRELARSHLAYGSLLIRQGDYAAGLRELAAGERLATELQGTALTPDVRLLADVARRCVAGPVADDESMDGPASLVESLRDRPVLCVSLVVDAASMLLEARLPRSAARMLGMLDALGTVPTIAPVEARASHVRARLAQAGGNVHVAADQYRTAVAAADRARSLAPSGHLRAEFADAWHRLTTDACAAALDAGRIADAFDAVERFRARSLHEQLAGGTGAGGGVGRPAEAVTLGQRRRELVERLRVLYRRTEQGSARGSGPAAVTDHERIVETERELERVIVRLDQVDPSPLASFSVPSLEAAAEAVPADTAFLSYFREDRGYGVFAVRRGDARVIRALTPAAQVESQCRRLRVLLDLHTMDQEQGRVDDEAWRVVSGRIFDALVAPVNAFLQGAEHVVVVPAGDLHGVPFHALHTPRGWWHESAHIRYSPSIGIAHALVGPGVHHAGRAMFAGVSDALAPRMDDEARVLAGLVPGSSQLIASAATVRDVLAQARRSSLLHLATHCVFSPLRPTLSRLKLHDGWVSAGELAGSISPGSTVLLAGCDSGRTSRSPGEERLGLVRTLLAAGSRAVLHAQWRLNDAACLDLMSAFYRTLHGRATTASIRILSSALGEAQQSARRLGLHPAAWAPIFLSGGSS